MADAPEPFTYAELVRARAAVKDHAVQMRTLGTAGALAQAARYEALADKLLAHAAHLLDTGDVDAQRAELYR